MTKVDQTPFIADLSGVLPMPRVVPAAPKRLLISRLLKLRMDFKKLLKRRQFVEPMIKLDCRPLRSFLLPTT